MPKEPKLFPSSDESSLVNQKADFDIPSFDVQSDPAKEGSASEVVPGPRSVIERPDGGTYPENPGMVMKSEYFALELEAKELKADVARKNAELEALAVQRDNLLDQLDEACKVQPKATSGSLNHDIFCAVVNGFAARGDLSLGKLSGDLPTQQIMRHAAGITSFAAAAVKDARL